MWVYKIQGEKKNPQKHEKIIFQDKFKNTKDRSGNTSDNSGSHCSTSNIF
jgi:hypothetical protein